MALSGVQNFKLNTGTAIESALRVLGIYAAGESPSAQEITDGAQALNLLLKSWGSDGINLWALKSESIPLVANQVSYTLGPAGGDITMPRPIRIDNAFYRNALGPIQFDRPLSIISRREYYELSNKTSVGQPVSLYYDPQLDLGVLYLWPVPLLVANQSVVIVYEKTLDDVTNTPDDLEIPQKYFNALKWSLAEELALEYGATVERYNMIRAKASQERKKALESNEETTSIFLSPDRGWGA